MSKTLYSLTDAHRAQLKPWADRWIANAMSTEPQSETERELCRRAIVYLYDAAQLPQPKNIIFVPSPMVGALVWGVSAGVWWIRNNPTDAAKLFGVMTEFDLCLARDRAVSALTGGQRLPATDDATLDATLVATSDATLVATSAATSAATDDATDDATDADLDRVSGWLASLAPNWYRAYNGGKDWSAWPSYLSFFRHIAELPIDYTAWDSYEVLAMAAAGRFMHSDFAIICDRQELIKVDDQNRPHNETGPSVRWRCGHSVYHWHGTAVPREWIEDKGSIDPRLALTWDNIEQRRAAAEIIGWQRVLDQLEPRTVDEHPDPEIGTLLEVDLPDAPAERFLRMRCGTGRTFVMPVPAKVQTAMGAQEWIWQLPPGGYAPEVRT